MRWVAAARSDDPQALLAEARAQTNAGQTVKAIELYRRIILLLPADTIVRTELARLLARSHETRVEAEEVYRGTVAIVPRDAELAVERAANLAACGNNVNAALEYLRAFEMASDNEAAIRGFTQQILRLGAVSVQIKQSSEKLASRPHNVALRLVLAELLRSEARYNDALDHYWLAQRAAPDSRLALRGAAEAWLALGYYGRAEDLFAQAAERGSRGQALADQARVFLATERPEAALELLGANLTDVEKEPSGLIALADSYRLLGQTTQERATLEVLLALHPRAEVAALERLARIFIEREDKEVAQNACRRLLLLDARNAVGTLGLNLLGLTPPVPQETAQLETNAENITAARLDGRDQEAGEAALFLNQPALAIRNLRSALASRADSPRLLLELGKVLLQTKDADGAAASFAPLAITLGPRPDALFGLAQVETLRRNPPRALANYEAVLRLDPTNIRGLWGQAEALQRTGDIERAALIFSDLSRRAPESGVINNRLRETLAALGRSYRLMKPEAAPQQRANNLAGEHIRQPAVVKPMLVDPLLEAGDVIRVRLGRRSNSSTEVRLNEDGMMRPSFLTEPIRARCLTTRELSREISKRRGARSGSDVEVAVADFQRLPLIVTGAVRLPGSFNVRTTLNLREGLMLASGPDPQAGRSVHVIRGANRCGGQASDQATKEVETYGRVAAEEGRVNLVQPLGAGDIVIVPATDTAFVTGAI
ncbi:MAG: tetratricopeptide repeat protein, partial [Pyrinomonadaceae bacterium]|nr:tetratricopeptide repeat protein [Pyrinomonadaceae bacterium]